MDDEPKTRITPAWAGDSAKPVRGLRGCALAALVGAGLLVFGGWWAFVRPAQRMQAFCADIKPGTLLAEAYDRSVAAGFRALQTERRGLIVYVRNGTDTAACHIAHKAGVVDDAAYYFP